MSLLFSALLICVSFLTMFGLALWPVLFKQSKRWKWIFIGTNITFVVMLLAGGSTVARSRVELDTRREQMRDALAITAEFLENGKTLSLPMPSSELAAESLKNAGNFAREARSLAQ